MLKPIPNLRVGIVHLKRHCSAIKLLEAIDELA